MEIFSSYYCNIRILTAIFLLCLLDFALYWYFHRRSWLSRIVSWNFWMFSNIRIVLLVFMYKFYNIFLWFCLLRILILQLDSKTNREKLSKGTWNSLSIHLFFLDWTIFIYWDKSKCHAKYHLIFILFQDFHHVFIMVSSHFFHQINF